MTPATRRLADQPNMERRSRDGAVCVGNSALREGKDMITPAQLRKKAEHRYREVLKELLRGKNPFPLKIRYSRLKTSGEIHELRNSIQAVKSQSKEALKFGYTVEWREIETRKFGRNPLPGDISFTTADDFFGYLGKQAEAGEILGIADQIRQRYPVAFDWTIDNHRFLSGRPPGFWENIFRVVDYLNEHPFPDLFARELPVRVPTKFIEENEALLESLVRAVAPESYRPAGETFAERLGLRSPESLIEVRLLDPDLAPNLPLTHFTAAPSQIGEEFFGNITGVLITENRLTFLTLPHYPAFWRSWVRATRSPG